MIQRRDQINILSIVFEMYQLINCVDGLEEGERGTRRGGGKRDKIKISLPLPPQKKKENGNSEQEQHRKHKSQN